MIGLLGYLSTTVFFSSFLIILTLPFLLFRLFSGNKNILILMGQRNLQIALVFLCSAAIGSCILFVISNDVVSDFSRSIIPAYPYVMLILASFIIGLGMNRFDFNIILWLFVIETIVAVAEYIIGTPTFFKVQTEALQGQTSYGYGGLLYYSRVFGISDQSSALALKSWIVLGILFVMRDEWERRRAQFYLFSLCIAVVLLVTFNRTVLVTAVGFILFVVSWRQRCVIGFAGLLLLALFYEKIYFQFFRGKSNIDLSGRGNIFKEFWNFFIEQPLVGNYGVKLWLPFEGGHVFHSHNSFLQLLASNGIVVALLVFFGFAALALKKGVLPIVLLFSIYSLFQFGFFWGISFTDITLFGLVAMIYRNNDIAYCYKWRCF